MTHNLCTEDDEYVRERPRWVAELSDGLVVYGDDDRPGVEPPSAWTRLRRYCSRRKVRIINFRIQFRMNSIDLGKSRRGYFFSRTVSATAGEKSFEGFKVGYVKDGNVLIAHYRVPDFTLLEQETRTLDASSPSVIMNNHEEFV